MNELTLFIAHFNAIPNFVNEIKIDCRKANQWFLENFKAEIKNCYYDKIHFNPNKSAELDDIFYYPYEDLIVDFDTNSSNVRFLFRKTDIEMIERIMSGIKNSGKGRERGKSLKFPYW